LRDVVGQAVPFPVQGGEDLRAGRVQQDGMAGLGVASASMVFSAAQNCAMARVCAGLVGVAAVIAVCAV
jgi:hypothetical protein